MRPVRAFLHAVSCYTRGLLTCGFLARKRLAPEMPQSCQVHKKVQQGKYQSSSCGCLGCDLGKALRHCRNGSRYTMKK